MGFVFDVIIYTFSIFGMIIFAKDLINSFFKKKNSKIILVFEKNEEDFENIMKNILDHKKQVYVHFEDNNDKNIQAVSNKEGVVIINDSDRLKYL